MSVCRAANGLLPEALDAVVQAGAGSGLVGPV